MFLLSLFRRPLSVGIKSIFFLILLLNSFRAVTQNSCHTGDSLALVEFYLSANGSSWIHNENWLTGPVSTWYGVVLMPDSVITDPFRVHVISLHGNNLTGTISNLLCTLSELQSLYIGANNTTGTIPSCITQLEHLQNIEVAHNQLTNSIPNFANCPLINFYLNNNNFTGAVPDTLMNQHFFSGFLIDHNHFSSLPKQDTIRPGTIYHLNDNKFTFKDVIQYIGAPLVTCTYAPQDSVLQNIDTTLIVGSNLNLDSWIDTCQGNMYQWKKDGVLLSTNPVNYSYFYKPIIQFSDSGNYSCNITNPLAPLLTLHRRPIRLHVIDTGTGIQIPEKTNEIEILFDLSEKMIVIRFNETPNANINCNLYDISGKKVLNLYNGQVIQKEFNFNLTNYNLTSGTYFVILERNNLFFKNKKIILP